MNKLYNKINSYCINTISFDHDELQYIMQAVLGLAKSYMYNNPKKYKQILNLNQ